MKKSNLRATAALQALAILGAGLTASMIVATPASAQDYTRGSLQGTVTNPAGAPLTNAKVTLQSNEQGFTRTTTTDSNGRFDFTLLPTGSYRVSVRGAGGETVDDPSVSVTAGATNSFAYTAAAAGAAPVATAPTGSGNEIIVTGRRTQTNDFSQTTTGLTLDVGKVVANIPIARSQTGLILLAPGTNPGDTGFADCSDCVSFGGATIAENSYYVNGLNTTNFRTLVGNSLVPFEFYRTFDVKTGGWTAEYGRALGGVTSAVTKSGSNNFEYGSVISFSPNALKSNSPNTFRNSTGLLKNRNDNDYRNNISANFYASGAIIKDHLFAYALYSPRYSVSRDTSVSGGYRFDSRSTSPFFGAKIDFLPIAGQRLEGTFWSDARHVFTRYNPVDSLGNTTRGSIGTEDEKVGGKNYILQYTGQFTKWFTLSGLFGINNYDRNDVVAGTATPIIQSTLTGSTTIVGSRSGVPIAPETGKDQRKVYRVDADVYVTLLGKHHFRFGVDREDLKSDATTFYTGGSIYRFTPNYIRARTYINTGSFVSKQQAYYAQDSWDLFSNRLNLQLGIRNDGYENFSITGKKFIDQKNQWAPRLGASFDVFGDKKTKISAFFGRYYLGVPTNTNIRLGGAETFYEQRFRYLPGVSGAAFDSNGVPIGQQFDSTGAPLFGVPVGVRTTCPNVGPGAGQGCRTVFSDGTPGPTDTLVAAGLKPMFQDEKIFSITHRMNDWTFGLRYINRRLKTTIEDFAIDAAVNAYCDRTGIAGCADTFSGFHQYVLGNPGSDTTVRLDGDCAADPRMCAVVTLKAADLGLPKATRKYDAVEVTVNKAFNGLYAFDLSYTLQRARGNYEGSVKSDNNQADAGLTQDFDQPGLVDGANGILANERKHTLKFQGSIKPLPWLTIGTNITVQSGRNFSCIGVYPDARNFAAAYSSASFYCSQPSAASGRTAVPQLDDNGVPVLNGAGVPQVSYLVNRGTAFHAPWTKKIDLGVHINLPGALSASTISLNVFNVLNSKGKVDFVEFGENDDGSLRKDYGFVTGFQAPRAAQLTWALRFGGRR